MDIDDLGMLMGLACNFQIYMSLHNFEFAPLLLVNCKIYPWKRYCSFNVFQLGVRTLDFIITSPLELQN